MSEKSLVRCILSAVLGLAVVGARADVLNMPGGQTSLQTVPVGDPGNVGDTAVMQPDGSTGKGAVNYVYSIGKYEVTNAQYCQFLNDELPTISDSPGSVQNGFLPSDTYGLYNPYAAGSPGMGSLNGVPSYGAGAGLIYDYSAPTGQKFSVRPGYDNMPVCGVLYFDALRFVNWLQNGQGGANTENGAYTITNATQGWGTVASTNRVGWVLPNENEWYKAAYYKGGGTNSGYWLYPTSSNTPPTFYPPGENPDPTNAANYWGLLAGQPKANNAPIPVGSYSESLSPYGTLDQGGNAAEWIETPAGTYSNGMFQVRGGDWVRDVDFLKSTEFNLHGGGCTPEFGFRVAFIGVPEPGSLAMLAAIAAGVLLYWQRRRT